MKALIGLLIVSLTLLLAACSQDDPSIEGPPTLTSAEAIQLVTAYLNVKTGTTWDSYLRAQSPYTCTKRVERAQFKATWAPEQGGWSVTDQMIGSGAWIVHDRTSVVEPTTETQNC